MNALEAQIKISPFLQCVSNLNSPKEKARACIALAAAILIFIFGGYCPVSAQQNAAVSEKGDSTKTNGNYRIGAGDILRVTVVKQALLSVDGVRVGNDGTIRLPMLDASITAACLTEVELAEAVNEKYRKYLINPQVYVAVTQYNANPVALVGAVNSPGRFQLQRETRLLELLTFVNGPSPNAGKTIQIIRDPKLVSCRENVPGDFGQSSTRVEGEEQEIITLPLAEVMQGSEAANPFLRAGDIVRISEAEVEQAFIIGNVRAAATISLKEPVTLSKAIAMAGGIAPGANIEKIKISRQQPNSLVKNEFIVNLKEINKRNQDDVMLQANDIIDVPGESGTRKFIKDVFRTVVPAVTRIPIVIP